MTSRIIFGGLATWFGRMVNILLGLVLMPILFRHLSNQALGTWLFLAQSITAIGVFDLGFSLILTRRIAFAVGNARANVPQATTNNSTELSDLFAIGRRIYGWLALTALVLSFVMGVVSLRSVLLAGQPVASIWLAWGILCLSQSVGIWAAPWNCLLQGTGNVGWDTILASLVTAITLGAQIAAVALGGSVLSLALITAGGSLIQRLLIVRFVKIRHAGLILRAGAWNPTLFREMLPPALRAWVTSLGYLLVANTDQFFIASFQGAEAIPSYRAAFLLIINLHLLAGVFSGASPVFVSQLWRANQLSQIRTILRRNARIGLWSMACGSGAILALGPALFDLWLGRGNFVGYPVLVVFLVTFLLEHHANVFSTCSRATNDEAYAVSSIFTGLLKCLLAWALIRPFGLLGLALSTLIAQAAGNDWFMVYRSVKRLNVNFWQHLRDVLLPLAGLLTVALCLGMVIKQWLADRTLAVQVFGVSFFALLLLSAAVWRLVFTRPERSLILRRLRLPSIAPT